MQSTNEQNNFEKTISHKKSIKIIKKMFFLMKLDRIPKMNKFETQVTQLN